MRTHEIDALPGEAVLFTTQGSAWFFLPHYLAASALVLGGLYYLAQGGGWQTALTLGVLGLLLGQGVALLRNASLLVLTNFRVVVRQGLLRRTGATLLLTRVEGVEISQSLTGRALHYGDVLVRGVGTEVPVIKGISRPAQFRAALFQAMAVNRPA